MKQSSAEVAKALANMQQFAREWKVTSQVMTQTVNWKLTTDISDWARKLNQGSPECVNEGEKDLVMSYKKLFHKWMNCGLGAT